MTNLGTPVPVAAESIERELGNFWKAASETEGEAAIMRACSCNLVVIAQNREEAELLPSVLAEVAEWHPCRSIIAFRELNGDPSSGAPGMQAWVNAQCFTPFAGGPQVCCEAITIMARGHAAHDLSNSLVSVLVPDLPVFLYWRSFRSADRDFVAKLAQFADLLIVDSHASKDDPESRERLLELLRNPPSGISVRDLNWSRLTPWRDLIAQFFDAPTYSHHVWEIAEIEVCRALAKPGSIPTRTLLLIGWLATRLGWRRSSAERHGDEWLSRWDSTSGEVVVRLTGNPDGLRRAPGIQSVTLRTRSGAVFSVVHDTASACMTATTSVPDSLLVHTVSRESLDEAALMVGELSIAGEDTGFQLALTEALSLENDLR